MVVLLTGTVLPQDPLPYACPLRHIKYKQQPPPAITSSRYAQPRLMTRAHTISRELEEDKAMLFFRVRVFKKRETDTRGI